VSDPTSRSASVQLPLALRFPPDQRFETFVAAPDGALAQLRALARGEGASVYVAGAAATGKSHLLLAACAEAEQAGRHVAYLPMAAAAGRLRDALDALEQADLVALDGLDIVAGDRDDEIALFDAHNRAHDAGRRMLYAARASRWSRWTTPVAPTCCACARSVAACSSTMPPSTGCSSASIATWSR
jgi:DnaA family protein